MTIYAVFFSPFGSEDESLEGFDVTPELAEKLAADVREHLRGVTLAFFDKSVYIVPIQAGRLIRKD
jgi:hypothetical protein